MQLRQRISLLLALFGVAWATSAQAGEVEAASHLTLFTEPSTQNRGLRVIHPQTDVSASLGSVGLQAGYELDIVSGATQRVYAPAEGPDAISGATFSDTRHTARTALSYQAQDVGLTAGYSYGWENDYRSHTLTVAARGDFLERNFTLGLAYTHNFDSVCDQANANAQGPLDRQPLGTSDGCFDPSMTLLAVRRLSIDTLEPSLDWTATPTLLLQAGGTLQLLDGFQSNPYRAVRLGSAGREPQERLPAFRQRYAVFARAHQAVPILRGAFRLGGRLYRDSWGLEAATADAEWLEYLGPAIIVGARGRYHRQTSAAFFRTAENNLTLGPAGEYWTGDRELAALSNWMAGGKLAFVKRRQQEKKAWIEELEIGVRYDLLLYRNQKGAPNADRTRAQVIQAGASVRF